MIQSHYVETHDRVGFYTLAWRIYLACVAVSFLVLIEPAPTDLLFVLALGTMMLAPLKPVRGLIGPVVTVGLLLYVWFTLLSLLFATAAFGVAVRAVGVEIYLVLLMLMTAYFVRIDGDRAFRTILLALLLGGLLVSLIGVMAWLDLLPSRAIFFRDEHMVRVKATFKDPNVLGPYLIPSILLATWMVVAEPRLRLWAGMAAGLMLICLVLTFSRGAWAHMLVTVTVFFFMLLAFRRTALPALIGALLVMGLVLAMLLLFADALFGSVEDSYLSSRLSFQSYDAGRFSTILAAMTDMFYRPFGIGPNQAPFVYGYEPHNTFVILALQNGIPAAFGFALLYLGTMAHCLVMVLRQRPGWMKYAFVLAIMAGLFLLMNVVGSLHWRHIYVVMGLAWGDYRSNALFGR